MTSEFIALASASQEAEWLRNLLFEITLLPKPISPVAIHCDSDSALVRAYSKVYNGKSRHISLRHDLVKRLITKGVVTFDYVNTKFNLVDNFTKVLPSNSIDYASIGIGLCPINTNEGTQSNARLTLSISGLMLLSNSKYKTQRELLGTCDVNKIASIKSSLVLELKSSRWMCRITRTRK